MNLSRDQKRPPRMKINQSFLAQVFLAIVIVITTLVQLNNSGRAWSATTAVVLFSLIFIAFGYRWFKSNVANVLYDGPWPPMINTCPDYLVAVNRGNQMACVDLIGINRSEGSLQPLSKEDDPQQSLAPNKQFNYTYKVGMTEDDLKGLCSAALSAGLTWEGITNGESCTFGAAGSYALANSGGALESCKKAA